MPFTGPSGPCPGMGVAFVEVGADRGFIAGLCCTEFSLEKLDDGWFAKAGGGVCVAGCVDVLRLLCKGGSWAAGAPYCGRRDPGGVNPMGGRKVTWGSLTV